MMMRGAIEVRCETFQWSIGVRGAQSAPEHWASATPMRIIRAIRRIELHSENWRALSPRQNHVEVVLRDHLTTPIEASESESGPLSGCVCSTSTSSFVLLARHQSREEVTVET